MLSLTSLVLLTGEAFELVAHTFYGSSSQGCGVIKKIFDASDHAEGCILTIWSNDIEKDSR